MARFQERPKEVTGQLDTSGADVSRRLSETLTRFGGEAGRIRADIVEEKSIVAGMEAGRQGKLPTEQEFSIASKAFNRGLRASFLAETQSDIRDNVARIASENALNPVGFESAALAWEAETLNGIDDERLKASLRDDIRIKSDVAYQNIADAAQKRARDEAILLVDNEITQLGLDAEELALEGDEVGVAANVLKVWDMLDEQANSGFKSIEEVQIEKIEFQKRQHKELAMAKLFEDFEDMKSFDKAVEVMENGPKIKNMTNEEMRAFKQQAELELKRRIDRENLDEVNNQAFSDEEQKVNFESAQLDLLIGTLSAQDVRTMGINGEINGAQALDLAAKMGTRGRGIDSPLVENQITKLMLNEDFAGAKNIVDLNIGTNLSDATARGYLEKMQEYGNPDSKLNDPKVKRFRQHLKTSIGFKDSMSGFFDPSMQQRWGIALLEYDDAVQAGENPRSAFFRLTNDFTNPEQKYESMRNPYGSEDKEDLNTSLSNLLEAKEQGLIDEVRYAKELKYTLDVLTPAKAARDQWIGIVSNESKNEKAEAE